MLSRSLLARSAPLRLSATLTARVCLRPLSTLHLAHPVRSVVVSRFTNLRWSSTTPTMTIEVRDERRASTPSGTCYIANVPYSVTAEQLKDAFSEFGTVVSVKLLRTDAGLFRGVGFVHFESVEGAVKFVEANREDPVFVLDRQLHVEHAQKMKSIPKSAEPCDTLLLLDFRGQSVDEVREFFGGHRDNILAVRFDKKEEGRPSRKAFIQFRDVSLATEALDAFQDQNNNSQITYARQRQPPANAYSLTSRLSRHRDQ